MLLDDVATYLEAQGIGTIGTDLFKGEVPDAPDGLVALFEYGGLPPNLSQNQVWDGEKPGLQVRTRGVDYATARTKAEDVVNELHGIHDTDLSGTRYQLIKANQNPFSIGKDANDRSEFSVNFSVIKDRG